MAEYVNLSRPMGDVIGAGLATLKELQIFYDSEDLFRMWEAYLVMRHNTLT